MVKYRLNYSAEAYTYMYLKKLTALVLALLMMLSSIPVIALEDSPYYITVDIANQIVTVYDSHEMNENGIVRQMICSTGVGNCTPTGIFTLPEKKYDTERTNWYYFTEYEIWAQYATRIKGPYLFHSILFNYKGSENPTWASKYNLGSKASHGCIRVQKAANSEGQNIKWLWDNIKVNTKVLIWDDTGRIRPYPAADDYELYYNPNGGQYYHEDQYCASVKSRFLPLTAFTYGELDTGAFAKLTPCPKCASIMRKSQIDAMNAEANK